MLKKLMITLALTVPALASAEQAAPAPAEAADTATISPEQVRQALAARLPKTRTTGASETPIKGLYAVTMEDGRSAFVSPDGRYFIVGVMFDLGTGKMMYGMDKGFGSANKGGSR